MKNDENRMKDPVSMFVLFARFFAIMARRVGLTKGAGLVILSLAVGKILGSLVQFFC